MDALMNSLDPVKVLLARLAAFLPTLIKILIILPLGWLVARVLQGLLVRVLKAVRLDDLSDRVGLEEILRKGGVGRTCSELLGIFLYWVILLGTLAAAVNALGLTATAELLDRVLLYVPNVIAGVIVLILGAFFASMLGSIVQTVTVNAGVQQARALGQVTRVVILVFAIEVALEKFIGTTTLHTQLNIVVAAAAFGTALAFGLGCKDLAGRWAAELIEKLRRG